MSSRPMTAVWMTAFFLAATMSGLAPVRGRQGRATGTPDASLAALVDSADDVVLVHVLTDSRVVGLPDIWIAGALVRFAR